MLEDYRKVIVDRRGEEELFTYDHIMECMKKGLPNFLKCDLDVHKSFKHIFCMPIFSSVVCMLLRTNMVVELVLIPNLFLFVSSTND